MTEPDWNQYRNFSRAEFECKCGCGRADMSPEFMRRLQALRDRVAEPLAVSSGFRCPGYNVTVSRTGRDGPHTTGHAADILCHGEKAFAIDDEKSGLGFTGIGWSQKGDHGKRFVHLDDLKPAARRPRPWVWSY